MSPSESWNSLRRKIASHSAWNRIRNCNRRSRMVRKIPVKSKRGMRTNGPHTTADICPRMSWSADMEGSLSIESGKTAHQYATAATRLRRVRNQGSECVAQPRTCGATHGSELQHIVTPATQITYTPITLEAFGCAPGCGYRLSPVLSVAFARARAATADAASAGSAPLPTAKIG